MSTVAWSILALVWVYTVFRLLKEEGKSFLVFSALSRPQFSRYVPYFVHTAAGSLLRSPQEYIDRDPVKAIKALQAISGITEGGLGKRATKAIVDHISSVAAVDVAVAAKALLTVIHESAPGSDAQMRALTLRPGLIEELATSDPMQAVLIAQKGIVTGSPYQGLSLQSYALALKYLDEAYKIEPIIASHAAYNIARKAPVEIRDQALEILLAKNELVTEADFESGHAAAEQAVLLASLGSNLHQTALEMWEWHIQKIMLTEPETILSKIFYGFAISTSKGPNKWNLYEHGFEFVIKYPWIIKEYPEKLTQIALSIGLRTRQDVALQDKAVHIWTLSIKELCRKNLSLAIQAANQAMTFTPPDSQFEKQARSACAYLKKLQDADAENDHNLFEGGSHMEMITL